MRYIFIWLLSIVALSTAQDYRSPAILTDARYLSGDGTFGAAYTQEDGVQFKEESDAKGNRKGSYSYVDPTGQRRTVFYTAGKDGFQAIGDGIPEVTPPTPPQPEYEPLPEYNPPDYKSPTRSYDYDSEPQAPTKSYDYDSEPQPVRRVTYEPRPSPSPPPPPLHPRLSYQHHYQPEYEQPRPVHEYRHESRPLPVYKPQPTPPPPSQYHQQQPVQQYRPYVEYSIAIPTRDAAPSRYNEITTPPPRRFYPPGKLDFTRTPDGFSYSFSKS
ncbi:extensin-3 [Chelonus insularis]|uniref:extensin-3 n=1 Tax=Chelonus insularis TaxID=460826 RepID=UPI00158B85A1|nr:extensin-3 [Chelonus insularis]